MVKVGEYALYQGHPPTPGVWAAFGSSPPALQLSLQTSRSWTHDTGTVLPDIPPRPGADAVSFRSEDSSTTTAR